jgi:hypothetical protein
VGNRQGRIGHDHLAIEIVGRPVEIDHRARRAGDQQRGAGLPRHRLRHQIDQPILQPPRRLRRMAHRGEQRGRIGSAGMRHGQHHRDRRRHRLLQDKSRAALAGDRSAFAVADGGFGTCPKVIRIRSGTIGCIHGHWLQCFARSVKTPTGQTVRVAAGALDQADGAGRRLLTRRAL